MEVGWGAMGKENLYSCTARENTLGTSPNVRAMLACPSRTGKLTPPVREDSSDAEKMLPCIEVKRAFEGLHLTAPRREDLQDSLTCLPEGSL